MRHELAFAFGMWMVIYPVVTGLLVALQRTGWELALPIQTLLVSAVLVPTIVFIVAPLLSRLTRR